MAITVSKQTFLREYRTVGALLDAAEQRPAPRDANMNDFYNGFTPLSAVRDRSWSGDMSVSQALEVARWGGWSPDFAPEIRGLFDDLVPRLRSALSFDFERRLDYSGDQVDIQSYVDGMPEQFNNWFPTEMETKKGVITVLLGVGLRGCTICSEAACSAAPAITAEDVFIRGQAITGLLRALKLMGFELEVWTEYTVSQRRSGKMFTQLVRVQAAGAPTDEGALEFACGHPAWTRKVLMRAQELDKDMGITNASAARDSYGFSVNKVNLIGYGSVMKPIMSEYVGADVTIDMGDDWFNTGFYDGYGDSIQPTPQMVLEWTVAQLQACGVLSDEKAAKVLQEAR